MKVSRTLAVAMVSLGLSARMAFAQSYSVSWFWGGGHRGGGDSGPVVSQVPEVDASTGIIALFAVAAASLLMWEMRRRRNQN